MIRWTIAHARYGSSVTVEGPATCHVERNQLRGILRAAELGGLAGRDEQSKQSETRAKGEKR